MKNDKIIIIGGVAAGATAAGKARRVNPDAEIIIFEKGPYISFANCGLPYYIGGEIENRRKLFVASVNYFKKRYRVDVRTETEINKIDANSKKVFFKDYKNNITGNESYDKLIVCTGSTPIIPPIPGINSDNIFTIWTVPDTDKIYDKLNEIKSRDNTPSVSIIGGGFVGLEMAEAFIKQNCEVTIIEKLPQVMPGIDPELAGIIHKKLTDNNINLILNNGVKEFITENNKLKILLEDNKTLDADMVVLCIGVKPNISLLKEAGAKIGKTGGVIVNDKMETSLPDIYAAGDIVEFENARVPLAGPANRQGRIAASNSMGLNKTYPGTLVTSILRCFDLGIAKTGYSEKELNLKDIPYKSVFLSTSSHVNYYPDSKEILLKISFDSINGKILGAQAIGKGAVDRTIDTFAVAIRGNLTVMDLEYTDFCYSPPFSSAVNPVNMICYIASNILRGEINDISPFELIKWIKNKKDFFLLDVRTQMEYNTFKLADCLLIPVNNIYDNIDKLKDVKAPIVVYCESGYRSYIASLILKQYGKKVYNLTGGLTYYNMCKDVI